MGAVSRIIGFNRGCLGWSFYKALFRSGYAHLFALNSMGFQRADGSDAHVDGFCR